MNKEILKSALLQTADEKLFENIPENLPKAQVSEKLKKRLNNIGAKKKKKVGMIAAAVAVVLLATPVIYTQFKAPDCIKDPVTPETNTVIKKPTTSSNDSAVRPYGFLEDNVLVEDNATQTVSKSQITSTVSDEYIKNQQKVAQQYRILRNIKNFDDYDVYLDDDGRLNIIYTKDESLEIMKKHLDTNFVIIRKVKFSKKYLLGIQSFLTDYMGDEYTIFGIGSGAGPNNKVVIEIGDKDKIPDIINLLNENIENFDKESVKFEVFENGGIKHY